LWEFTVDLGADAVGKRRQLTKGGFATRGAAQEALQRTLDDMRGGVEVETRLTVAEYLAEWLPTKRSLRPSTVKSYREHIDMHIVPLIGGVKLRELRPRQVDVMLTALTRVRGGRALTPTTIRHIHSTLRVALNDAVRRRLIAFNPAAQVELPTERRHRTTVWVADQVARFLSSSADDPLYAAYHLAVMTGMRRGELCGLRWSDVNLDSGYLYVHQAVTELAGKVHLGPPKTKSGTRMVPLDNLTCDVLRQHKDRQASTWWMTGSAHKPEHVFTDDDGELFRPEKLSRRFRSASRRAGLPPIRFHDLRHTSASLALAAGVAMKVVSERLGHSTTAITADLYTHVAPAVARDAAEAIANSVAVQMPAACWRDVGEKPSSAQTDAQTEGVE
jgi:integrase